MVETVDWSVVSMVVSDVTSLQMLGQIKDGGRERVVKVLRFVAKS